MKAPFLRMLLMAMAATACHGAETLGYRFVTEPNISTPVPRCPVLAQAPAATPFAVAGDELHDLTAVARAERIPLAGGWALWNQTRKLLVVRGALVDQWRIAEVFGFNGQSRHVKVTVEWLRAKDPTAAPTEPAFAALGILGNFDMKGNASATLEEPDGRWKFSAEVAPQGCDDGVIDVQITAKWKGPSMSGTQHGTVTTSVVVADGKPCPLAAWYAVGRGDAWWLRLKAEVLLADGTCWRTARFRQVGESAQPWPEFTPAAPDGTLVEVRGWQVGGMPIPSKMIEALGSQSEETSDPFAATGEAREHPKTELPEAVIPVDLRDLVTPPMLDLRPSVLKYEPTIPADVFVAYDSISQRVVFASKNRDSFDQIESVFVGLDDRWSFARNFEYETWLFDAAVPTVPWMQTSLASRSGQKAVFEWQGRKHQPIISLEREISEEGNHNIGARYVVRCRTQPPANNALDWHGDSITHLVPGVPLLTDALKLPDGQTIRQGQRASVRQVRAE